MGNRGVVVFTQIKDVKPTDFVVEFFWQANWDDIQKTLDAMPEEIKPEAQTEIQPEVLPEAEPVVLEKHEEPEAFAEEIVEVTEKLVESEVPRWNKAMQAAGITAQ